MQSIGPLELFVMLGIFPLLILPIWAILDAATRPDSQWADQSKALWVVLLVAGIFLPGVGLALFLAYLLAIRPRLKRAA